MAVLAAALVVAGLALVAALPAAAAASRVAGADRYATACEAAKRAYPSGSATVVVTTGRDFPDALAASALAADLNAPILLTEPGSVPNITSSCLADLGASRVVIVGGEAAVTGGTASTLGQGRSVERVAGGDRYATAAAVARRLSSICAIQGGGKTAIIATGENFPDALAGGSLAARGDGTNPCPILLVRGTSVPQATLDALRDLGITNIVILGGTGAVSSAVEGQLRTATGDTTPTRLAGVNRQGTAVDVATFLRGTLGCDISTVILAPGMPVAGQTFTPDPLSASPLAGVLCAPILLTAGPDALGTDASTFIGNNQADIDDVIAVGGTVVLSARVLTDADQLSQTGTTSSTSSSSSSSTSTTVPQGSGTGSVRPELSSASIAFKLATASGARAAGTYVKYTFDEPIIDATVDDGLFHVWDASNTVYTGSLSTVPADVDSTHQSVTIYYATFDTAAEWDRLTLATVEYDAVRDADANENPDGDRAIGTSASSSVTSGKTAAPDLTTVGNFRDSTSPGMTAVDFTFDAAAFAANGGAGYSLVHKDNSVVPCTGPTLADTTNTGTAAGGSSKTKHVVECPDGGTTLKSTDFTRGVVQTGTVSAASGSGAENPLEAAKIGSDTGISAPSLQSATLTLPTDGSDDSIVYTFNQAVETIDETGFRAYLDDGTEVPGTASADNISERKVLVTFAASLTRAVGASVVDGSADSTASGLPVRDDEVGVTNASTTTRSPGYTTAPNLQSVTLAKNIIGNYFATYTFDENLDSTGVGAFYLYLSDGTQLTGTACSINASPNANSVSCTAFGAATSATIGRATLGSVSRDAVEDADGEQSPEAARRTTGGTGTPAT